MFVNVLKLYFKVKDVVLQDSEPSDATRRSSVPGESAFKETLEKYDLSFTFHDGAIPFICPPKDEPAWSVNIKRGILSAFQNTMPRFDLDHETLEVFTVIPNILRSFTTLFIILNYRLMSLEPVKWTMCSTVLFKMLSMY